MGGRELCLTLLPPLVARRPEVARELAERALVAPRRPRAARRRLTRACLCRADLGDVAGIDHLREALAAVSPGPERAHLVLLLGPTLTILNHHEEAIDLLAASLDEAFAGR